LEEDSKYKNNFEVVKLRLRGKGSGYKEGPNQKGKIKGFNYLESNEPLHLCVSSKHKDIFLNVCSEVEKLLLKIYEEYSAYNQKKGKPTQNKIILKKIETSYGLTNLNFQKQNNENQR
jgi:hypothetical protein